MREAVIAAAARTPIGKAYRGAFNNTQAQTLGGHAIAAAVKRSGIDPAEVDDVIIGTAMQQGSTGYNVARQVALRAGLPASVAGMSIDRQCASGLMAIATAAKEIVVDGMSTVVAGGLESISLVQNEHANTFRAQDPELVAMVPAMYMSMLETAETVSRRYGVSRAAQDAYGLRSQQLTAAAQAAGRFDAEIVPVSTTMLVTDKATGEVSERTSPSTATRATGRKRPWPIWRPSSLSSRAASSLARANSSPPAMPASFRTGRRRWSSWKRPRPNAGALNRSAPIAAWRSPGAIPTRWASARSLQSPSC